MIETLWDRLRNRDRNALSRLVTLASRGGHEKEIGDFIAKSPTSPSANPPVVAVTGSGGVGKSTLIGKLIGLLRRRGHSLAVLACDPQSPRTGGALLGDRVRMTSDADDQVFIRSLAAPSGNQSLASNLKQILALTKAFGFDRILLETVGAGQGDTAVRDVSDLVIVLVQPEAGDELQWEKAGLLEVADIVVVHKAELPGAEHVAAQLTEQLSVPGKPDIPVVLVSSATGKGLDDLWSIVESRLKSPRV